MVAPTSGDEAGHAGPDLRLTDVPAVATALTRARERLTSWARTAGLEELQIGDVTLATYEAMANVADHAYDQPGGVFDLHACRRDGVVTVTVTDHGRWKSPGRPPGWRGRGLLIIERAAGQFELTPHARGTTVCMSWPVRADEPSRP
ncbi:ATP-binding protein [Kutzneria kofuensis]|uniref:Anti-sigma regulatory factor (Ser/Thr protein kinase) n=1 Tax=Kutzneria kofuensis TaxID=103725 RepID=A0A7W9KFB0_9PSEU|nr:ATP-binding protein [Kutzneria kofuensis]MBB5891355.1 anti-sigma regulatory factor (Ser/Thr protein kinase) [Kutzneria kofuensis]